MKNSICRFLVLMGCICALTACGSSSSAPVVVDIPAVSAVKASDYTGSWSGTLNSQPVTFSLYGDDGTDAVTGNVYSPLISGAFSGSVASDGTAVGTVVNRYDGNTWSLTMGSASGSLNIVSATFGLSSLGTGSCTQTPVLVADMSGSWIGYMVKREAPGYSGVLTVQNITAELAYSSSNRFVGGITSDAGLSARFDFTAVSGWWMAEIEQASSWGSKINEPKLGVMITQDMITSKVLMDTSFVTNLLEPSGMQGMKFTTTYDKVYSPTVTAEAFDEHDIYLVRQGGTLVCPVGWAWSGSVCVAD